MAEIKTIKIRGTTYDIRDESKLPINGGTITGDLELSGTASPELKILGTGGAGTLTVDQIKLRAICRGNLLNDPVILTTSGATDAAASQIIYVPSGVGTLTDLADNWSGYEIVNKTMLGNPVKALSVGSGDTNELIITYLDDSEDSFYLGMSESDVQDYINNNYYTKSEIDSGYVQLSPASTQSGNIKVSGTIGNGNVTLDNYGLSWYGGATSIHGGTGSNEGFWIKSWSNSLKFSKLTGNNEVSATYKYTLPSLEGTIALIDNSNQTGQITATSFYATSDKRLKENIKEFIPQKSILDLPVVEFDFKDSGEHTIGCLAQDLQEICPQIVNENANGYLSINEGKIIYLLLDEVKKLRKEINLLKENK